MKQAGVGVGQEDFLPPSRGARGDSTNACRSDPARIRTGNGIRGLLRRPTSTKPQQATPGSRVHGVVRPSSLSPPRTRIAVGLGPRPVGMNLIAVGFLYLSGGHDAKTLADLIEGEGGVVNSVQRWGVGGSQAFDG